MGPLSDDDVSEILFSLVTDRQLDEYLDWSITEDALNGDVADHNTFIFGIMTEDQVGEFVDIEREYYDSKEAESFAAPIPYAQWYGACIYANGQCHETTMEECRLLGGRFQGPDTRCNPDEGIPVSMAAEDKTINGTLVPKEIREYLGKHPEVANLYDDDDAGVLLKGLIIGVVIGALGTVVGNIASEFVVDTLRATSTLKHNM